MLSPLQIQLRAKALIALEEAVQECRYRKPRRGHALRFALAWLWSLDRGDRTPFDEFWQALAEDGMWRFGSADRALFVIYRHLGVDRPDDLPMRMWKARAAEERAASPGPRQPG
jgi:hypothetical protein